MEVQSRRTGKSQPTHIQAKQVYQQIAHQIFYLLRAAERFLLGFDIPEVAIDPQKLVEIIDYFAYLL